MEKKSLKVTQTQIRLLLVLRRFFEAKKNKYTHKHNTHINILCIYIENFNPKIKIYTINSMMYEILFDFQL